MRFLLLLLLTSCSSVHVSTGYIDPMFGGKIKPDARNLSALHTSIQAESVLLETENFRIDVGVGPSITTPLEDYSPLYGAEISNRLTYKATETVRPYFFHAHGIQYHDSLWYQETAINPVEAIGSDVRYAFSTRIGAGIAYQATENFTIDLSYQWVHFSSGKSMFGDKTRQFFGLPKAKTNNGFEGGAVFLGVSYEW